MEIGGGNRVIFMGTPEFAVPCLESMIAAGFDVVAAYTREPSRRGRGRKVQKSPIHVVADGHNIPVLTPKSFKNDEEIHTLKSFDADIIIVVAYGKILPKSVLELCPKGCVNVHGSLLPRWRGAAPINRAIMAGDGETGIDIMLMDEGLDTGDILASRRIPISPEDTAGIIHDRLSLLGAQLLPYTIRGWIDGALTGIRQSDTQTTYAKKLSDADRRIDWTQSAKHIHGQIMGLSPRPGAWFECPAGADKPNVRVGAVLSQCEDSIGETAGLVCVRDDGRLIVQCGEGAICLLNLKPAGSKAMSAQAFITGYLSETKTNPVSFL